MAYTASNHCKICNKVLFSGHDRSLVSFLSCTADFVPSSTPRRALSFLSSLRKKKQ